MESHLEQSIALFVVLVSHTAESCERWLRCAPGADGARASAGQQKRAGSRQGHVRRDYDEGNMGVYRFRNLARWNVDMSASKAVKITESKSVRLRADFTNIFNHPLLSGTPFNSGTRIVVPSAPSMDISGNL
jgi:hypothetical protein